MVSSRQRAHDVRRGGRRHLPRRRSADAVGHHLQVRTCEARVLVGLAHQSDVRRRSVAEPEHPIPPSPVAGTTHDPNWLSTPEPRAHQSVAMEGRATALDRAHHHASAWLSSLDDRPVPAALDADEVARRLVDLPDGTDLAKPLRQLQSEMHQIADDIRLISHQFHHATLMLGLPRAAADYCSEFAKKRGINVEFTQAGPMDSLPEPVPLVLFRVMQEALNNVARHSGAAQVEVSLLAEENEVRLRVKDR